jgi:hypothetical protein
LYGFRLGILVGVWRSCRLNVNDYNSDFEKQDYSAAMSEITTRKMLKGNKRTPTGRQEKTKSQVNFGSKTNGRFFFDENEYGKKIKSPRKTSLSCRSNSTTPTRRNTPKINEEKKAYANALNEVIEENTLVCQFTCFL